MTATTQRAHHRLASAAATLFALALLVVLAPAASAQGTDTPDDEIVSPLLGMPASVSLEVSVNGHDADNLHELSLSIGEAVTWDYVVLNDGPIDIFEVSVGDDRVGPVCATDILRVGQTFDCSRAGSAAEGHQTVVATVFATSAAGEAVVDRDMTHYLAGVDENEFVGGTGGGDVGEIDYQNASPAAPAAAATTVDSASDASAPTAQAATTPVQAPQLAFTGPHDGTIVAGLGLLAAGSLFLAGSTVVGRRRD